MLTPIDLDLDPELLSRAKRLTSIEGDDAVVAAALDALIARESARRLALLGLNDPKSGTPTRGAGERQ